MKSMKYIFLLPLLLGGSLLAQWGDCWTFDIHRTGAFITDPYEDANDDGCRDDDYRWFANFHSMVMNGAPQIPNGAYHRVKFEVMGTNSYNYNDVHLLKTVELNPDNFTYYSEGLVGYRSGVNYRMENSPVPYKYGLLRVSIVTYIWHNFGPAGYYVGFAGSPCDSRIITFCRGAAGGTGSGDPGNDPKPDLLKGNNGSLSSSDGTTYIDGLGNVPRLRAGASFSYDVDCKNEGNATATNFQVQTYVNTSNTYSPPTNGQGPFVGNSQYVGSLAANASVNHSQTDWVNNHSSKFSSSGFRYFHTYFDDQRVVDESSETNNSFSSVAYYYHAGSGDPAGREGTIRLEHLNSANEISFLFEDLNSFTSLMESKIGNGLQLLIYPVSGALQLQLPVFQATITQKNTTLDISGVPPGAYRLVINGTFIKRMLLN